LQVVPVRHCRKYFLLLNYVLDFLFTGVQQGHHTTRDQLSSRLSFGRQRERIEDVYFLQQVYFLQTSHAELAQRAWRKETKWAWYES